MQRIGLVLSSLDCERWVHDVVHGIINSSFAQLELVIVDASSKQGPTLFPLSLTLLRLYEQWDRARHTAHSDAGSISDISALIRGITIITTNSDLGRSGCPLTEELLNTAATSRPDVVLCLDKQLLDLALKVARYGVWSIELGDYTEGPVPDVIPELLAGRHIAATRLLAHRDKQPATLLYESYSSVDPWSLYRTRNPMYWKAAEMILRALRTLDSEAIRGASPDQVHFGVSPTPHTHKRFTIWPHLICFAFRRLRHSLRALRLAKRPEQKAKWCIGIRRKTPERPYFDQTGYSIMQSESDGFYADPFLFERDGRTYLFFEDYRNSDSKGRISYCNIGSDGTLGAPIIILERDYHLSYPFVIEDNGEVFMIPETKGNRAIELYRATEFPAGWILDTVLLNDIYAVDATVYRSGDKFWMFAAVSNGRYSNCDELAVFLSDSLRGPWVPHLTNPVISHVGKARPAGSLFVESGRLIRPTQDCGPAYGYAVVFSEVTTLTDQLYEEREIARLTPHIARKQSAIHTYTRTSKFEAIDLALPEGSQGGYTT